MKKFLLLMVICLPLLVLAGAPTLVTVEQGLKATVTCSTQHTASVWQFIDSVVIAANDTAKFLGNVRGSAVLDPGDVLYVGLVKSSATTSLNSTPTDTFIYRNPYTSQHSVTVEIGAFFMDSTSAALTDTILCYLAVEGSSHQERVTVSNFELSAMLVDIVNFE